MDDSTPSLPAAAPDIEDLVAQALEIEDGGDPAALEAFLTRWPAQAGKIRHVLRHARTNGLLDQPCRGALPERLGEFRLIRRLGGGGMGLVFEAEQTSLQRRVAIKVIRADLQFVAGARERFRREVDAVARLQHPGIVPIVAVGEESGVPYFAMELVRGCGSDMVVARLTGQDPAKLSAAEWRRLAEQIAGGGPAESAARPASATTTVHLSWWEECVRLASQVADAMAHAHSAGIVHRDLKPSNVMVTPSRRAQIVDFGLAHIDSAQRVTRTGSQQGSPAYMSPEQLQGAPVDERTDVYSLGVTLYEWVTLCVPFAGATVLEVKEQALRGSFASIRSHNRAAPRDLDTICRKAMDFDRERRYASMAAFAADLDALLQHRPIEAQPPGYSLRLLRAMQRHRTATALALFVVVATAITLLLLLWQSARANARLTVAYDRAQLSMSVSLDAVDQVLRKVAHEDLAEVPGTEILRLSLLQAAAQLHDRLAGLGDSDELRLARARALRSQAIVLSLLGRHTEAASRCREIIAMFAGDAQTLPLGALWQRATAHDGLAQSLHLAQDPLARTHALTAASEYAIAVTREPTALRIQGLVGTAGALTAAAKCARENGNWQEEEPLLLQALSALDRAQTELAAALDADDPTAIELCTTRGATAYQLAFGWQERGRAEEALALVQAVITAIRQVPAPGSVRLLSTTSDLLGVQGLAQDSLGLPGAVESLREAVALAEAAVRHFSHSPAATARLGSTLHNLALVLRSPNPVEATVTMRRAVDLHAECLRTLPDRFDLQRAMQNHVTVLLRWLQADGDYEGGLALAATLGELRGSAWRPFAAGRHIAELTRALADSDATHVPLGPWLDRAMAFLLEAEKRGWPPDSPLDDEVFAPLVGRADYQALRARLAGK